MKQLIHKFDNLIVITIRDDILTADVSTINSAIAMAIKNKMNLAIDLTAVRFTENTEAQLKKIADDCYKKNTPVALCFADQGGLRKGLLTLKLPNTSEIVEFFQLTAKAEILRPKLIALKERAGNLDEKIESHALMAQENARLQWILNTITKSLTQDATSLEVLSKGFPNQAVDSDLKSKLTQLKNEAVQFMNSKGVTL